MFFAPPEVRSLSKYSEFGAHLGNRDFLIMLAIAIALHAISFGIYSLEPHEKTTIVPVRVLNIKLNSGMAGDELQMPPPASMPGAEPAPPSLSMQNATVLHLPEKSLQAAADKTYKNNSHKPLIEILTNEKLKHRKSEENLFKDRNIFVKPKRYVRESELAYLDKNESKLQGNGTNIAGSREGKEIATKYEQEISMWVTRHQIYPEAAEKAHIEGKTIVRIRIDRNGHIIYSAIDTSSGSAIIDQAVMQMVRDSDPVPRVPDNYPTGRELEFLIPISFTLKK